jgi:hypothetical protein
VGGDSVRPAGATDDPDDDSTHLACASSLCFTSHDRAKAALALPLDGVVTSSAPRSLATAWPALGCARVLGAAWHRVHALPDACFLLVMVELCTLGG